MGKWRIISQGSDSVISRHTKGLDLVRRLRCNGCKCGDIVYLTMPHAVLSRIAQIQISSYCHNSSLHLLMSPYAMWVANEKEAVQMLDSQIRTASLKDVTLNSCFC